MYRNCIMMDDSILIVLGMCRSNEVWGVHHDARLKYSAICHPDAILWWTTIISDTAEALVEQSNSSSNRICCFVYFCHF